MHSANANTYMGGLLMKYILEIQKIHIAYNSTICLFRTVAHGEQISWYLVTFFL